MKNVLLATAFALLVALTGCGSDKPANNLPAPTPEDSGVTGPPPKGGNTGGDVPVGGRTIPGGGKK